MSQSGRFFDSSGPGGVVQTLTGDVGGAITPILGNINIIGGSNITTTGTPLTHDITVDLDSTITIEKLNIQTVPVGFTSTQQTTEQAAIQTIGNAPTALITLPLVAGQMLTIKAYINGFKSTKDQCLGAEVFATFYRSPAGNVTLAGEEVANVTSTSTSDVDATVDIGTQSAIVNVIGVNLETWNWVTTYSYMYLISEL